MHAEKGYKNRTTAPQNENNNNNLFQLHSSHLTVDIIFGLWSFRCDENFLVFVIRCDDISYCFLSCADYITQSQRSKNHLCEI